MNKKKKGGVLNVLLMLIFPIIFVVILLAAYVAYKESNDAFKAVQIDDAQQQANWNESITGFDNNATRFPGFWDFLLPFVLFILFFFFAYILYKASVPIEWLFLIIPIMFVLVLMSVFIGNVSNDVLLGFGSYTDSFSLTMWLFDNYLFVEVFFLLGLLGAIIMGGLGGSAR